MKSNLFKQAEARKLYELYWESYLQGDLETFASTLDEEFEMIGTSEGEIAHSKSEGIEFYKAQMAEVVGKVEMRNRSISAKPLGGMVLINENCDIYVFGELEWSFYSKLRLSTLIHETAAGWKILQQHGSLPDMRVQEGETLALEKITKENLELRDAVKRRTIELENKSKELEIEAALERVRAVAMGMKKPEDMLDVCRMITKQLEGFGVTKIRNVQTAIIDETIGQYLCYQYFPAYNQTTIEDTLYHKSPVEHEMVRQMLASRDGHFIGNLKGEELEAFRSHRKEENQFPDPILDETAEISYSFLSIGEGGLGLSLYIPMEEKVLTLFQRFHQVFSLAYQRFRDIEKAEKQAREAEIELALERVRSTSLAMHTSQDLSKVVYVVFSELVKLDAQLDRCLILTVNPQTRDITWYLTGKEGLLSNNGFLVEDNPHPSHQAYLEGWRTKRKKWHYLLAGEEKMNWDAYGFSQTGLTQLPDFIKADMAAVEAIHLSISSDDFGCLIASSLSPLSDAHAAIVERFSIVFNQTYTRFLDLQKAEAQAREAQIEAAVERVRAQSMAMHHTDDLHKVTEELLHQLKKLSIDGLTGTTIYLVDPNDIVEAWDLSSPGNVGTPGSYTVSYDAKKYPVLGGWVNEWRTTDQTYFSLEFPKEALLDAVEEWKEVHPEIARVFENAVHSGKLTHQWSPSGRLSKGILAVDLIKPPTEDTKNIVTKMSGAFNLAYQRFEDLKKAETQAREAQIEAGLERVRAQTMAMHSSEDIGKCILKMFEELTALGVYKDTRFGIGILNHDNENNQLWTARKNGDEVKMHIGHLEMSWHPLLKSARQAWLDQIPQHQYVLEGKDLLKYYQLLNSAPDYKIQIPIEKLPEKEIQYCFIFEHGFFYAFTPREFQPDLLHIIKRFTSLFAQTYRRYLDLQKAEAQVRESQIEAALEKVRSRSLAMQKPEELVEVAELLRGEMGRLGVEELETSSIYLMDSENKLAECWYAIKDIRDGNKSLVSDEMTLLLPDTWVGSEMWKFFQSKKEQVSIVMKGDNRKEWINYCAVRSQVLQGYYGNEIPERTYHLVKFTGGYMGAASPGEISQASWDLLKGQLQFFPLPLRDLKICRMPQLGQEKHKLSWQWKKCGEEPWPCSHPMNLRMQPMSCLSS